MTELDTVVVKYGSASVANESGMDAKRLSYYASELARLKEQYGVVVVSSGSVAVGRALGRSQGIEDSEENLQSIATLGSGKAFTDWQMALASQSIPAGAIWVTHREIDDDHEGSALQEVIRKNLALGMLSIINENDALSETELAKLSYGGDNDGLARHIAVKMRAGHLCLMTDREGLLDNNGQVVETVTNSNADKALELAQENFRYGRRSGGMKTKVIASLEASRHGINAHIAHFNSGLLEVIAGHRGTHFPAQ